MEPLTAHERKGVKYSTQRVDMETVTLIKTINLQLIKRGIKLRHSDLIKLAFLFIRSREWEFIHFIETEKPDLDDRLIDTISRVISKPWFPYGNFGG